MATSPWGMSLGLSGIGARRLGGSYYENSPRTPYSVAQLRNRQQSQSYGPLDPWSKFAMASPTWGQMAAASAPSAPAPTAETAKGTQKTDYESYAYNYAADPILQELRSGAISDIGDAKRALVEGQRRELLRVGAKSVAQRVLGANDPTVAAVSDDPDTSTSALARIKKQTRDYTIGADDDLNKANLYYSSNRLNTLSEIQKQGLTAEGDTIAGLEDTLSGLEGGYVSAVDAINQRIRQAEQEAYMRSLLMAILNAGRKTSGGGGDTGAGDAEVPAAGPQYPYPKQYGPPDPWQPGFAEWPHQQILPNLQEGDWGSQGEFPSNPTPGQRVRAANGTWYTWNGEAWAADL